MAVIIGFEYPFFEDARGAIYFVSSDHLLLPKWNSGGPAFAFLEAYPINHSRNLVFSHSPGNSVIRSGSEDVPPLRAIPTQLSKHANQMRSTGMMVLESSRLTSWPINDFLR